MQDLYASSQQSAAGVQALLETALNEGRAIASRPAPAEEEEEGQAELTVEQLSNAAVLASSILASHGPSEVAAANSGTTSHAAQVM